MKLYGGEFTKEYLVEQLNKYGTITAVAKEIGVYRRKLSNWYKDIRVENARGKQKDVYKENVIEGATVIPVSGKRVLVIGDTHCPATKDGYLEHCIAQYKKHNCNYVVHIGDFLDFFYLNYHEKDIQNIEVDREYNESLKMIQQWFKAFPEGTWIIGNHDSLLQRKRKSLFLPKFAIREMRDIFKVPDGWGIENKIIIDNVLYIHRLKGTGKYTHINAAKSLNMSIVIGHEHTKSALYYLSNEYQTIFGMSTGSGIDINHPAFENRFDYQDDYIYKPIISCGVVYNSTRAYVEPM